MAGPTRIYGMSLHHLTAIIRQAELDLNEVLAQVTDPGSLQNGHETIQRLRELQTAASGVCPQQLYCNLVLSDTEFDALMAKKNPK